MLELISGKGRPRTVTGTGLLHNLRGAVQGKNSTIKASNQVWAILSTGPCPTARPGTPRNYPRLATSKVLDVWNEWATAHSVEPPGSTFQQIPIWKY